LNLKSPVATLADSTRMRIAHLIVATFVYMYKTHGAKVLRSVLLWRACDRAILSIVSMASRGNKGRSDGASTTGPFQGHPPAMAKKKKAGSGKVCTFPEPADSSTTGMLHFYNI